MGEAKKCCRCHEVKSAEDSAWRRKHKGQRDSFCRLCRAAYGREHYETNKQRYIDQDKSFAIGAKLVQFAWQRVLEEMEKCEVVCANCHRRRTAQRRGAVRAILTQT